jgi:hypothetical protein
LAYKDKTSVDFAQSRSTGYGKICNQLDLGFPVVTDLDSGPLTLSIAQYKAGKGVLPGTSQHIGTCNQQTIDKSPFNLATPAIQTEELDVGFYSLEARTNIKSPCLRVSS